MNPSQTDYKTMTVGREPEQPPAYAPLVDKTILLGVTGGIAAYKAADYARRLMGLGAHIIPILTREAARFVGPVTFSALCGNEARVDLFAEDTPGSIPHIELARQADLFLIMPATANILAKCASGIADDLLTTILLCFKGPVLFCPSMNPTMYQNPATQSNLKRLIAFGYGIVEPDEGAAACGEQGRGRLARWQVIREAALSALTPRTLSGMKVLVTAGPTREPIDPVRFLSNRSSGLMGYAVAKVACRRGADVTLVTGPTDLSPPPAIEIIRVETAQEMGEAVGRIFPSVDVAVMSAAVSDYRPLIAKAEKIKKQQERKLILELVRTRDILSDMVRQKRPNQLIVGFCAETGDLEAKAIEKLREKRVDLMVANDVSEPGSGFDVETNRVLLITSEEEIESLPLLYKEEVAERVWDKVKRLIDKRG